MLFVIFIITAITFFIETISSQLINFVSILSFVLTSDKVFTTNYVILIISYYSTLCMTFGCDFMKGAKNVLGAKISLKRVEVNAFQSHYYKKNLFSTVASKIYF